jgi:hypothetical protein
MNAETVIKYHLLINIIFGILNFVISIIYLLKTTLGIPARIIVILFYPFYVGLILFFIFGVFTMYYYLVKKITFKLVILSVLNIFTFPIFYIQLAVIAHFYVIIIFFYSIYLKLSKITVNKNISLLAAELRK